MKKNIMARLTSIRRRDFVLLSLVISSVLITFAVVTVTMYHYAQSQLEKVKSSVSEFTDGMEIGLDEFIEQKINTLNSISKLPAINGMNRWKQSEFILENCEGLGFRSIFIIDNNGIGYYPTEGIARNQADTVFFHEISIRNTYVTDPFYPAEDQPFTTICVALYNDASRRVGTLCGTIYLSAMQNMISRYREQSARQFFLVSRTGKFLTAFESRTALNGSIYENPKDDVSCIVESINSQGSSDGLMRIDGVNYYARVNFMKNYNWAVVVCIPYHSLWLERNRVINMAVVFMVCYLLLIVLITLIVISWNLSVKRIYRDSLCCCGSRAACEEIINTLNRKKHEGPVTVLYADMNNFKYINDTFGHEKGDAVLFEFSNLLQKYFADFGFTGRMGGDEFIVILENMTPEEAETYWKPLAEELSNLKDKIGIDFDITCSHGYAVHKTDDSVDISKTLKLADDQMYMEKSKFHS